MTARALQRDPRVSAADCATLASWLNRFVAKMEAWGVRVSELGRLRSGSTLFDEVSQTGAFPSDPTARTTLAHAVRVAMDFRRIEAALNEVADPILSADLATAMKGTLGQGDRDRTPYQFQSQYYVGSLFAASGLDGLVPPSSNAAPDFLVRNGNLLHGIEVKRPSGTRGLKDGLRKAAKQLDGVSGRGMVSIDLSDCLDPVTLHQTSGEPTDPWKTIEDQFDGFVLRVRGQVFGKRKYNPSYQSVLVTHCFARGWHWPENGDEDLGPSLYSKDEVIVFFSTPGTLWHHRSIMSPNVSATPRDAFVYARVD